MSQSAHSLIASLEDRIKPLEIEFHKAYWDSQIDARPEHEERRATLELELRRAKGDPEALADVNEHLNEELHDPLIRRQLEVLKLSLTGNQMSDEQREQVVQLSSAIESDFASYRPEINGRPLSDNDIEEILRISDDAEERKRAWYASKEVGNVVAARVRELARVRNQVARDLGYGDYFQMSLDLQELSEDWLFDVLGDLERLTEGPFKVWKQELDDRLSKRFATERMYPWHYADPFFQAPPPGGRIELDRFFTDAELPKDLAEKTFAGWGIDITDVLRNSDLHPRANKCQHAFCLDVDRSRDVRILANVVPGERWVEVMLHESGHAAYDMSIDQQLPYLLRRPTHIFVTEAIAILSGRLLRDPEWLKAVAGIAEGDLADIEASLKAGLAAHSLLFSRWGLVMVHFERELYADPEADLDTLWWELVERFQLVQRPDDPPDGAWAAKIHIAVAPVYYQNYLLGELLASQLRATATIQSGGLIGKSDAGLFFKERVFRPGALLRWDSLIEEATGSPLAAEHFASDVTI
jgi:peptidyl-dipeptidase A